MLLVVRNIGLIALLLTTACVGGSPRRANPNGCSNTADCDDGFVCNLGVCRQLCNSATDCNPSEECTATGICMTASGGECESNDDCDSPPACQEGPGRCIAGSCNYAPLPQDTPCEDGDLCTAVTVCNGAGSCVGPSRVCDSPPINECVNGNATLRTYAALGECQSNNGQCEYDPIDIPTADCNAALNACAALDCSGACNSCESSVCMLNGLTAQCQCLPREDGASCSSPTSSSGVCANGACRECILSSDCQDFPTANSFCWTAECLPDGTCDYTVPSPTLQCAAQSCSNGEVTFATECGLNGTCPGPNPATGDCGGLVCDGNGCLGSCTDSSNCVGALNCNTVSGACEGQLSNGAPCTSNGECLNTCIGGVCADLSGTQSPCDDAQDCNNGVNVHLCSPSNTCLRVNTSACSDDDECSETCIGATCSPLAALAEVCDDTDDCETNLTCSVGLCKGNPGETCVSNSDCADSNCQCASSDCAFSICSGAAVDCSPCAYVNTAGTSCTGSLDSGVPCGAGQECDGSGNCVVAGLPAGDNCTSPSECEDGFCECRNNNCTSRVCATLSCGPCGRVNSQGTNCMGDVDEGTSCGAGMECDSSGNCDNAPDTSCSTNGDCVYNNCECGNSSCSQLRCGDNGVNCGACTYLNSSATSCTGNVSSGNQGLCGTNLQCDGAGVCECSLGCPDDCVCTPSCMPCLCPCAPNCTCIGNGICEDDMGGLCFPI